MDYELIYRLATLALGAIATWRVVVELIRGRHGSLRDEYRFARDFLQDLKANPGMHPFLKQKGLQAIAGDTSLSTSEVEYILGLRDSPQALKDYVLGRPYLDHLATAGAKQIAFKGNYSKLWSRRWRKALYLLLYTILYLAAVAPLLLLSFKVVQPGQAALAFACSLVVFLPPAFLALRAGVRIARAEELVRSQYPWSRELLHAVAQP